jgi:hypothetical protein
LDEMNRTLFVLMSAGLLACGQSPEDLANGDDPVAALEASAPSTRYDSAYWANEAQSGSQLWTQAVEKCSDEKFATTPNCAVVAEQRAAIETDQGGGGSMMMQGEDLQVPSPEETAPEELGEDGAPESMDAAPEGDVPEEAPGSTEEEPPAGAGATEPR